MKAHRAVARRGREGTKPRAQADSDALRGLLNVFLERREIPGRFLIEKCFLRVEKGPVELFPELARQAVVRDAEAVDTGPGGSRADREEAQGAEEEAIHCCFRSWFHPGSEVNYLGQDGRKGEVRGRGDQERGDACRVDNLSAAHMH